MKTKQGCKSSCGDFELRVWRDTTFFVWNPYDLCVTTVFHPFAGEPCLCIVGNVDLRNGYAFRRAEWPYIFWDVALFET